MARGQTRKLQVPNWTEFSKENQRLKLLIEIQPFQRFTLEMAKVELTARTEPAANWRPTGGDSAPAPITGRRRGSRDSAGKRRAGTRPLCTRARPNCRRGPASRSDRRCR